MLLRFQQHAADACPSSVLILEMLKQRYVTPLWVFSSHVFRGVFLGTVLITPQSAVNLS